MANSKVSKNSTELLKNYSEEQLLAAAFNSTDSVRFIVGSDGTIFHFNRKAYENGLLLHNKTLKPGDSIYDYANDPANDVATSLKECLKRCFAGETFFAETEIHFGTEIRWFKSEYVPVFDKLKIIAASLYIHEVTDQKIQELRKDVMLATIKDAHLTQTMNSSAFTDLVAKCGKDGLRLLKKNSNAELKTLLNLLITTASDFKSRLGDHSGN